MGSLRSCVWRLNLVPERPRELGGRDRTARALRIRNAPRIGEQIGSRVVQLRGSGSEFELPLTPRPFNTCTQVVGDDVVVNEFGDHLSCRVTQRVCVTLVADPRQRQQFALSPFLSRSNDGSGNVC